MANPSRYYSSNAAKTTLSVSITSSSTSLELAAAANLPTQYPYTLILEKDTANEEVVEVTSKTGTAYNITRNIDNSGAKGHAIGANVEHGVSARDFTESRAHEVATTNVHGATGDLVDIGTVQTITAAKTFNLANITANANIKAGGFKVTGLADGTASTDAATKGQLDAIAGSATAAAASATASATSAGQAATSATNAANSANTASTSAATATTQAGTATTQAGIATTQAGLAAGSATTASNSAATAATSAATATTQAGIATTQAGIATTSAGLAASSATASATSAGQAATSASSAAASYASTVGQVGSGIVRDMGSVADADTTTGTYVSIATVAASAATSASSAATSAASAATSATSASGSATTASASAATASTSAGQAATSASSAATSASSAATSATSAANSATQAAVIIASAIQGTIINAKGDLLVGTADDTVDRLPVGTNGYLLTATSTTTSGISWAPAPVSLPSQGGNGGKYLTTDGSTASWAAIVTDPLPQIFLLMGA